MIVKAGKYEQLQTFCLYMQQFREAHRGWALFVCGAELSVFTASSSECSQQTEAGSFFLYLWAGRFPLHTQKERASPHPLFKSATFCQQVDDIICSPDVYVPNVFSWRQRAAYSCSSVCFLRAGVAYWLCVCCVHCTCVCRCKCVHKLSMLMSFWSALTPSGCTARVSKCGLVTQNAPV